MPEGPEIRRAADRVAEVVTEQTLSEVTFAFEHLKRFEAPLRDAGVERVDTHGKAMLTRFRNGLVIYSHNQLYGRWMIRKDGKLPKTGRSLRLALRAGKKGAFLYSASAIAVLESDALATYPPLSRLGPDPLHRGVGAARIQRAFDERTRAQLGALLLDQSVVAGIGNYLRSEILFAAGLLPHHRPGELSEGLRRVLAAETLALTRRAYETGGITTSAAYVRESKARGLPRRAYRHYVFGRAGQRCVRCERKIQRTEVAGRRLYFCGGCQR